MEFAAFMGERSPLKLFPDLVKATFSVSVFPFSHASTVCPGSDWATLSLGLVGVEVVPLYSL
jgi:hypothetical protein